VKLHEPPGARVPHPAVLAADGHSVETARDGADALRLLDSAKPYDLIVSDLKMPGLDGPSLTTATACGAGNA